MPSSKHATRSRAAQPQVSPEKMRALISLYHQSKDFITPETLSVAIDDAFLEDQTVWGTGGKRERTEEQLHKELKDRRALPKLSTTGSVENRSPSSDPRDIFSPEQMHSDYSSWSSYKPERDVQLKAALYGIEPSGDVPLPGLEVLEEEHDRIQRSLKD